MHRAVLAFGSDHRNGSSNSGANVEVRVHQRVQFAVGFTNAHLDPGWLAVGLIDSSNFETRNLADDSTMIINRSRSGFAQDRGEVPHLRTEDRWRGDRLRLNRHQVHSIDRQHINTKRFDRAHSPGERSGVFGLSHDVQMVDLGSQPPDQSRPGHPFIGCVEHAVARTGLYTGILGRRDETPGDAEGIVNDQFRAKMAPNKSFELGTDELTSLLLSELIAQDSALDCFGCLCFGSLVGLLATTEATLEALNTTGGVDDLHLTGEEGVARRGDVDLVERIGVSVFPLDGLSRLNRRLGEDGKFR